MLHHHRHQVDLTRLQASDDEGCVGGPGQVGAVLQIIGRPAPHHTIHPGNLLWGAESIGYLICFFSTVRGERWAGTTWNSPVHFPKQHVKGTMSKNQGKTIAFTKILWWHIWTREQPVKLQEPTEPNTGNICRFDSLLQLPLFHYILTLNLT